MIKVKNLTLTLNQNRILDDISFEVPEKETLVVMGKNGCGKTMLLKSMVGLVKPQMGSSIIDGKDIIQLKKNELDQLRKNIGYVFQQSGLFDSMTIAENVVFPVRRFFKYSEKELRELATNCLNRSGLKDAEDKLPAELSGGMRKRAAIARAIALNPKFILMDDPAAGLDPVLTDAIANLILALRNDIRATFIVITHDLNLAYKLADRIALMINGKIHSIVPTEEFKVSNDPFIEQFREGKLVGPIPVVE